MSKYILLLSLCVLAALGPLCSGVPVEKGVEKVDQDVEKTKEDVAEDAKEEVKDDVNEEEKEEVKPDVKKGEKEDEEPPVTDAPPAEEPEESETKSETHGVPKITYSKETKVNPKETVLLDCEVMNVDLSGLEGFKIKWSKVSKGDSEDDPEKVMRISSNQDILLLSNKYDIVHTENTYKYSLKMDDVNEKDSGVYRCTIEFSEDQTIDADVPVQVLTPAYFADQTSKTINVVEGDSITMDCQPGGQPTPEVYWERAGEELPYYGGNFFKANQFELPVIDRSHKGQYVCYADNGLGEPATSEIYIEVEYKPSVKLTPSNVAASVYDRVVVECESEAKPASEIRWMKGGERISPSSNFIIDSNIDEETGITTSTLEIVEVQVEDFAEYACFAENSVGSSKEELRVEMKTPPRIEMQTKGEKVYELKELSRARNALPLELQCIGSGVPTPQYRWTKDGEIVLWQSDPRMSLELGTGTLLIREPDMKDNGNYQCFAYNELGVAASDVIMLTNNSMIDFIRKEDGNVHYEAEIGRPFRFACPKAIGYPAPKMTWMKARDVEGGVEMEYINNDRMVIDEEGTLWISHVTKEDDTELNNFEYTCLATSELHPQDISLAKTITLKTVLPADGRHNLEDDFVNIESFLMHASPNKVTFTTNTVGAKLWCIYGGEPVAQVIWQRADGSDINYDRFYVQNEGQTLIFRDVQLEDAGEYTCLASNGVGTTKKHTINVEVEVAPKFKSDFEGQAQVVQEGTTVTFACAVLAEKEANPTYQWFFNSKPLQIVPGSRKKLDGSSLVISSATKADTGNYACKASNEIGYAYGQTTLSVIPRSTSPVRAAPVLDQKVLEAIKKNVETLTTDVKNLKEIVQNQAKENKMQENMAALLQQIAEKVLHTESKPEPQEKEEPAKET